MKTPQAIVLAGGAGRRFWPVATSKPLLPFLGKTLIEHTLTRLKDAGVQECVIVTSPENHSTLANLKVSGVRLQTVTQPEAAGMADGVLKTKRLIAGPVMIVNATDVVETNLYRQVLKKLEKGENVLVATKTQSHFPGGYLTMKGTKITGIVEKPALGKEPSDFIKLVVDGFQDPSAFFNQLKSAKTGKDDAYEVALSNYLNKARCELITYTGSWQATKYPWDILGVMELFLKDLSPRISKDASVSPHAVIEGPVVIEAGVQVMEHVAIKGPTYIGKNTVIGTGALVRESMVSEECVVGYNTEVVRSYVGRNSWFHTSYVGDSVIASDVSFGSGAVLANVRLDEGEIAVRVGKEKIPSGRNKLGAIIGSGSHLGVNTSIMPGVLIGENCFIAPGSVVDRAIPDNTFVSAKTTGLTFEVNRTRRVAGTRDTFRQKL